MARRRNSVGPLYNVKDTCERLGGISRTHLYTLIKRGEIHPLKLGKRTMFSEDAIDTYIDEYLQHA